MEALTIENKGSKRRRLIKAIISLYFTLYCGYFTFAEAAIDRYEILFYASVLGAILGLFLFLSNTLWSSDKKILTLDKIAINSNIRGSKFKIEWTQVSSITMSESSITFFTDGGRKQRTLDMSRLYYIDVKNSREKIAKLCEHKNIVLTHE